MGKGSRTSDFHHKNTEYFLAKMMPFLQAMTKSAVVLLMSERWGEGVGKGSRTSDFHHKNTEYFLAKMMPFLQAMTKSAVVLLINDRLTNSFRLHDWSQR